jgi:hypothetical protein
VGWTQTVGLASVLTPSVAFTDDDSRWALLVGREGRPDPICAAHGDVTLGIHGDLPGPSVLGCLACGAVVRREAFLAAGGLDDPPSS